MHTQDSTPAVRLACTAQGQVQGVGFRPTVYRIARGLGLTGHVGNTSDGVVIEIQGAPERVRAFPEALKAGLPPLAVLTGLAVREIAPVQGEREFAIAESHGRKGHNVLISPDVGICPDCLRDMRDPANRRWRYPFTSCTNCGPRYTITRAIPYDRKTTSMACFPLCPDCAREYRDPMDRRFDAQPIACPACGPRLWLVESHDGKLPAETEPAPANMQQALARTANALAGDRICAIRGLGGFQLACDARSEAAVQTLRQRKLRPHKAFALMAGSLEDIRDICLVSVAEEALLTSSARPVAVLARRPGLAPDALAPSVAPDTATVGVMLPTTPLHATLFDLLGEEMRRQGRRPPLLVMTSGNLSGDPICLGNREALSRLADIADCFLLHDRDILCRVDDSVAAVHGEGTPFERTVLFRRARGYVPSPAPVPGAREGDCVFGAGAGLKACCCFTRGADAFAGQHIGDLESTAASDFYEEAAGHLMELLEVEPALCVADDHPDFPSRHFAKALAMSCGAHFESLQHHAAHAFGALAENGMLEPSLALALDGTGLGTDGTVWGGELMLADLGQTSWQRLGSLEPLLLPGGDQAAREPWRIAFGLALEAGDDAGKRRWHAERGPAARAVQEMVQRRISTPLASSCGRLFDAAAAELGLCTQTSYEGQAAMRLERAALASPPLPAGSAGDLACQEQNGLLTLPSKALFGLLAQRFREGAEVAFCARLFHEELARLLCELCVMGRERTGLSSVALAGGVMQNRLLAGLLTEGLARRGFRLFLNRLLPPGDGGIAYGQACWGARLLALGKAQGA